VRDRPTDEDGFSLVETVVAMMVFAVVAVVAASMLISTLSVSENSSQRVIAANLAATYVEEVRGMRALDIPDGGTVYPPVTVQGTSFTAQRTANYVSSGSTTSICAGGGSELVYKLVTVTVTWPDMGNTKPVRSDTLKALGLGEDGLNKTKGMAAIGLLRADGTPLAGVNVTLKPVGVTRQTGVDGCALFTGLDPAVTYEAAVDQPDHTGLYGDQALPAAGQGATLQGIVVKAGEVTRRSLDYDRAGKLAVSFSHALGYPAPPALGVTLSNTVWAEGTRVFPDCATVTTSPKDCVTGTPRVANRLFPGLYGAWAGTCSPAPASVTQTQVRPDQTSSASVPLAPLGVDLRDADGKPVAGRTLYLLPKSTVACSEAFSAVSDAAGSVQISLPSGTWILSLTADGSLIKPYTSWPEITLDAYGDPAPRQTMYVP
jgi:prepilin-type N-terminal cleavage/methylation domain-containing protein